MTVSDLTSDPTSILVAGAIFSVALIAVAIIAILIVRRVRNDTKKPRSANEIHITDQVRPNDSGLRIKPIDTGNVGTNMIATANQASVKIIKKEPEKAPAPEIQPQEVVKPPAPVKKPDFIPAVPQPAAKSAVDITPKPVEKAPEPEKPAQPAETESKADDPFNIFSEISMDQSPTSKFAANLKDVDIHDLNEQAQTLMRTFKSRSQ